MATGALILRPNFSLAVQSIDMKAHAITTLPRLSPSQFERMDKWPLDFEVVYDALTISLGDIRAMQQKFDTAARILRRCGYTVTTWNEAFDNSFHIRAHKDES